MEIESQIITFALIYLNHQHIHTTTSQAPLSRWACQFESVTQHSKNSPHTDILFKKKGTKIGARIKRLKKITPQRNSKQRCGWTGIRANRIQHLPLSPCDIAMRKFFHLIQIKIYRSPLIPVANLHMNDLLSLKKKEVK